MKLYFSLFLFLLLFAEYISYHVFTYNLKVLTVFLFIYTVSMCVCVWIHRHVKIRQLWGCTFPGTKLSYGMCLYLLEHLTNPPILKH